MRDAAANLFLRLHAWASSQDENFTSESFAYVLQHLIMHEPVVAVTMLYRLTGRALTVPPQDARSITISTQISVVEGRPDIEIRGPDHLVYVEVKVEAELGERQLERYCAALRRSGYAHTSLVLLSRYAMTPPTLECHVEAIRWYDIADWLEEAVTTTPLAHPASSFIVTQFLGFLRGRNLAMGKVGSELGPGVQALGSLLAMMKEVIAADERIKVYNTYLSSNFVGYYLGAAMYYFGLFYDRPAVFCFETYDVKLNKDLSSRLGVGRFWEERPVGLRWEHTLDLGSEDIDFYALPKVKQLECVGRFYRESLDMAEQMAERR